MISAVASVISNLFAEGLIGRDTTKMLETDLKTYLTLRQKYASNREKEIEQEEEDSDRDENWTEEEEEISDKEIEMKEKEKKSNDREKEIEEKQSEDEEREESYCGVQAVEEQDLILDKEERGGGKIHVEDEQREGSHVHEEIEKERKDVDNKEMLKRIYLKFKTDCKENNQKFSISEFRTKIPKSNTYFKSNTYRIEEVIQTI